MFFDSTKRQICEVKTPRTNTPMHALATLNDVTYVEAARHLAEELLQNTEEEDARLVLAGRRILSRAPSEEELSIWKRTLGRSRERFTADPASATAFLSNGDSARDESLPAVEHAALANVCLLLLNLDETLTKE